jgi:ribosomal protein L3
VRSIGFIPWDKTSDGPYRTTRSAGSWRERKDPIKVYKTAKMATSMGGDFREVFVEA